MLAQKLRKGDKIGIFSPSRPATHFAPKRFFKGKKYLEDKGFKIVEGNLTGKSDFYRSGNIKERAEELNSLIRNPEIRCIMSTIGGINSNSLLPYLDYDSLIKDPKIIIGYSDVTALLLGIYAKTGLVTYYGPALVASFGEWAPFVDLTYKYFSDILVDPCNVPYKYENPPIWTEECIDWESQNREKLGTPNTLLTLKEGRVEGRLIGGNLNTMGGIWGSEYMPSIKEGDILFIEDSLHDIGTLERSFAHLKISGVFDRIGGLILGKHELFDSMGSGRRPHEVLLEVLGEYDFPLLAEYDCCHTHPMITLPLGAFVSLDTGNQSLTLLREEEESI